MKGQYRELKLLAAKEKENWQKMDQKRNKEIDELRSALSHRDVNSTDKLSANESDVFPILDVGNESYDANREIDELKKKVFAEFPFSNRAGVNFTELVSKKKGAGRLALI